MVIINRAENMSLSGSVNGTTDFITEVTSTDGHHQSFNVALNWRLFSRGPNTLRFRAYFGAGFITITNVITWYLRTE